MSKKIKTILFLTLTFLFFLTTPSVIFYSQGYRFDFENKKIVKTGAFYFRVFPKGAEVFVDGKLKKKTDFFFGAAFLENLLPKNYQVEIKKEGYHPWKKKLEIKEERVTEAKNIFLFPEDLDFKILAKDLKNFYFSPDERKIAILQKKIANGKESWDLKFFDLEKKIETHLIEEREISKEKVEFKNLIWSPDSKKLILETKFENEKKYFLLDSQKVPSLKPLDFLNNLEDLSFHPKDQETFFFKKEDEIFQVNGEGKFSGPILKGVITYKVSDGNIFWISKDGFLEKSDLDGKSQKMSLEPFPLKERLNYQIEFLNSFFFLKEGKDLFLFNENLGKFEKIKEEIKDFKISPDSKKVSFWSDSEIEIMFLKEEFDQPQKKPKSRVFLARFSKEIGNVFWYNNHYLIFNVGEKIKAIEIDDRDEIQLWDLKNFENPEIYFNQIEKRLYVKTKENLLFSEKFL